MADLFRFKIDIKLSQGEFLSFIASDFNKLVSPKYFKAQWKVRLQTEKNGILNNIEIYINSLFRRFVQVLTNLFRFKIDIELFQLGFLSSMASEFKNLFVLANAF